MMSAYYSELYKIEQIQMCVMLQYVMYGVYIAF